MVTKSPLFTSGSRLDPNYIISYMELCLGAIREDTHVEAPNKTFFIL